MKINKFIAATVAAAFSLTMAACSSSDAGQKADDKAATGKTVRVWFMEGSISEEAQKYLTDTFAKENPGNTLKVEVQQWDGIVSKLQTSLASKNESPDLVEIGNTQTTSFTTVGAFADVTSMVPELGGDKLIKSFVDASTVDGKVYALPLYAGSRGIFYRQDLFEKAGIAKPKTISEFADAVIKLQAANPDKTKDFSGMYMAAVDAHGIESFLFANGFDYAKQEGGKWVAQVATPKSIEALKLAQKIFKDGTKFGLDTKASQKNFQRLFNDGTVGVMIATANVGEKIDKALWDANKVGVMALPSQTEGTPGQTFAGGSNIAMAANSQNPALAKAALKVIFSEGFQKLLAHDGWVPGNTEFGKNVTGKFKDIATVIIQNSKLTPNTPQWGVAVGDNKVNDFYTRLAKGDDVETVAKQFNDDLNKILNSGK